MRFGSILAVAAATLAPVVSGIITGIAVPKTIKAGGGFNLIITTANYIQRVYDVSGAVGIAPGKGYPGSLGPVLGSFYLGPGKSNILTNITEWVSLKDYTTKGHVTVSVAITSLFGAVSVPVINTYNVSVTVGDFTSGNYVHS